MTFALRKNCPNTEFFLDSIFPYFERIRRFTTYSVQVGANAAQKKLCIWGSISCSVEFMVTLVICIWYTISH